MKIRFKDLDSNIKLNNGELIVIASRPSTGKTTFALNILSHIAIKEKKGVLFFSLEDSKENITKRLIISNSMAPIYLSCDAPLSIDDICKKAKKMKQEKNIEAIIIDYIQLIKFDKKKLLSRDDEMTEILRRLKVLAKELDILVFVTSQLSRASKERNNPEPIIDDFSSSKYGITKYADIILFLYRDLDYTENENKIYLKIENSKETIKEKCYDKAYQLYGKKLPIDVKERLDLELNSIIKNNFQSIYLISSELVQQSKELGYEVGNRGSVGNSFVAYLLGIVNYNPIEYNLPFEIFAGKNYDKEPDIDLNFSKEVKKEINLYKFDILEHDTPTMLHELEKETNTKVSSIDLKDKEVLKMFLHANDSSYPISINGIPDFETNFVKSVIEVTKPQNINDLACVSALSHGSGTWNYNASDLISNENKKVDEVISNRADIYNYLLEKGIEKNTAYDITEFIWKGNASKERSLWEYNRKKYRELINKWKEYKKILQEHNIPDWYIKDAEKIDYIFPKSHAIEYAINAFKIAWYKVYYPKAFYKVYFKVKSNLNVKNYYCKRQVKTSLNREYDLKESNENNDDKIRDLEIILEMFERGILKEKKEIKDDYNLINSRAIGDYCRQIGHKFNTEELAVLVHRNNIMSMDEKIAKYQDLIDNYPDMEVIERINCKHYDSVKELIKKEIERNKRTYEDLLKKDKNSVYTWYEYNKMTGNNGSSYETINHLKNNFTEIYKSIEKDIKEYDETNSFTIVKKFFNKKEKMIYAYYNVINKKPKLIKIYYKENGYIEDTFLDIDNIYVYMPTPFKKGDILISSDQPSMKNIGDNGNIFVLEYLSTWQENIKEYLAKGNHDSSDMIGYGYYLYENEAKLVLDTKWDYDSFEYYGGEIEGNNRILKAISSYLKGKIGIELLIHAYDLFKIESIKKALPDFYTEEGLKLAGFTDIDIQNEKNNWK